MIRGAGAEVAEPISRFQRSLFHSISRFGFVSNSSGFIRRRLVFSSRFFMPSRHESEAKAESRDSQSRTPSAESIRGMNYDPTWELVFLSGFVLHKREEFNGIWGSLLNINLPLGDIHGPHSAREGLEVLVECRILFSRSLSSYVGLTGRPPSNRIVREATIRQHFVHSTFKEQGSHIFIKIHYVFI